MPKWEIVAKGHVEILTNFDMPSGLGTCVAIRAQQIISVGGVPRASIPPNWRGMIFRSPDNDIVWCPSAVDSHDFTIKLI